MARHAARHLPPDAQWAFTVGARYSGTQYCTLDNSDVNGFTYLGVSKYFTVDLRVRYQIDRQWSAAFGIDNLNNYQYWNFHPYPQRTYVAELQVRPVTSTTSKEHAMTHASSPSRPLAACALLAAPRRHRRTSPCRPAAPAAGSDYEAAFRVGHACKDAKATTGITVRLPKGFTLIDAQARKGWKLDVQKSGDGEVRWTADSADTALPGSERAEFIVRGKLAGHTRAAVLQGAADLRQRQRRLGAAAHRAPAGEEARAFPAARLDVLRARRRRGRRARTPGSARPCRARAAPAPS